MGSPLDVEATLRTILSESIGLMIDGGPARQRRSHERRARRVCSTGSHRSRHRAATPAAAALAADLKALIGAIAPALRPVLIMNPVQAASLGLLAPVSSLTVLVAPTVAAGTVIAVDAAAFASAMGVPAFRASQNAALHEEDTTPLALGTGAQGSGCWQCRCDRLPNRYHGAAKDNSVRLDLAAHGRGR